MTSPQGWLFGPIPEFGFGFGFVFISWEAAQGLFLPLHLGSLLLAGAGDYSLGCWRDWPPCKASALPAALSLQPVPWCEDSGCVLVRELCLRCLLPCFGLELASFPSFLGCSHFSVLHPDLTDFLWVWGRRGVLQEKVRISVCLVHLASGGAAGSARPQFLKTLLFQAFLSR